MMKRVLGRECELLARRRETTRKLEVRFAGSKTLLSYCGDQGFDSVAEATEFADHSISAVSS